MRILLASSSSGSRGGGEIFLKYLGQGLAQRKHELIFWCAEHRRMDELARDLAVFGRVVRSPYRNYYDHRTRILATLANRATSKRIVAEWQALRPEIIHVNKQNLEDGLDLLRAANSASVPAISTIHITQTARYLRARCGWLRDALSRRSLRQFKGPYVAVQDTRCQDLQQFLGNGHETRTILNGIRVEPDGATSAADADRAAKRQVLGVKDEQVLVLAVGRMEPQKRPLRFLETAARLRQAVPQARFFWLGGGRLELEWDRVVTTRQMAGYVTRMPWQTEVKPYLAAADLFLHVAEFEGLPFALIEAMAAGLPCAVTAELAQELRLTHGEGIVCVEDEPALVQLLNEPVALREIGRRAHRHCQQHYSLERMAREYESLYREQTGL